MVSRPKAVTDGFMCVAVHPCRVNKTIRIVLLTLQGCTATHMKPSVTAFGLDTIQAGVGEDNFHNLYLTANSKFNGAAYLGWIPHQESGRFTNLVPDYVCRVPSRSQEPLIYLADRATNLPEFAN